MVSTRPYRSKSGGTNREGTYIYAIALYTYCRTTQFGAQPNDIEALRNTMDAVRDEKTGPINGVMSEWRLDKA